MKFAVLSKEEAKTFDYPEAYIMISIGDPNDSEPIVLPESKARKAVLSLKFHDWDLRAKAVIGEERQYVFFNDEMAKEIIRFVGRYEDAVDMIAVHCEAGISRSAGTAAALAVCLGQDDSVFFKTYMPNSLVYSSIIRVRYNMQQEYIVKGVVEK